MPQIIVVVREVGRLKPDYALRFDVPAIPAVGSYLSIQRPDKPEPYGEDLVVRQVWWRLSHPETRGIVSEGRDRAGSLNEIFVECDPAIGPYSSDAWRNYLASAHKRGEVEVIQCERLSFRESSTTPPADD